ncbi:hypothetical protein [Azospirillum sp.]|uniref:hypothetical protein n=1 Tax=Azospirillum sp. TaxID=34012 RepID=UPI002D6D1976|nr:hypothetical protein [Azospirillum sp.]HYD66608.1 hypothetical protein [Azospirillum sp.]
MTVNKSLAAQALAPAGPRPDAAPRRESKALQASGSGAGLEFGDLLDAVNPLQHLPVVSSIYRETSGDNIGLPARLAGGFLFGGPMGLLGSAALALFEGITGDSPLGHLRTLADDLGKEDTAPTAVATAAPAPLPWMKSPSQVTDAAPAAASSRALTAALEKAGAEAPITPPAPAERPAPQLLAKLYELQATEPPDRRSIRV